MANRVFHKVDLAFLDKQVLVEAKYTTVTVRESEDDDNYDKYLL